MQDYQSRVIKERDELQEKIDSLSKFIDEGGLFLDLPVEDRFLLCKQRDEMNCYLETLEYRIMRLQVVH